MWTVIALLQVAQAETGSTQAVMALIVPPHDEAQLSAIQQPDPATWKQPFYNHEARVQIMEKTGAFTRQVWVTF